MVIVIILCVKTKVSFISIRSNQGFPYEDKKGKNAHVYKCDVCVDDDSRHCSDCRRWMDDVSGRDCHCSILAGSTDLVKIENSIKKKCSTVDSSWWSTEFTKVLDEFQSRQKMPTLKKTNATDRPKFDNCVEILVKKLAWTEEYAVEKMLPILTRWQVKSVKGKFI